MKRICLILLTLIFSTLVHAQRTEYEINPSHRAQTVEGWGVSLCWWAHMCGSWDDSKIDELVDWMVSPEGLNWNIFRYNIGGGDDPEWNHCTPHHMAAGKGIRAEIPGLKAAPDSPIDLNRDSAQLKLLYKIHKRRPDAIFEAFSNSAPYWMTLSGCVGGAKDPNTNNLNPAYYEEFAHYLVDACVAIRRQYGIEFRTLEPFNEPVTDYWYQSGSQEGCHISPQAQIDFLRVLNPILCESGLQTVIAASDETSIGQSIRDFEAYEEADALHMIDQWNTHSYEATDSARAALRQLVNREGKTLWMSEVGMGGRGILGNLQLAQKMFDDLRILQPTAWMDWQYVEERGNQWSLVTAQDWFTQQYKKNYNYYIRQQVTRYITAGYTFVDTPCPQCLAAISPDESKLVIVMLNTQRDTHTYSLGLRHVLVKSIKAYRTSKKEYSYPIETPTLSGHTLEVSLPPLSITTYILQIK